MPNGSNQQTSKQAKVLRNVLRAHFTLDGSQADLELLCSIADGTYAHTKPGNASFHAYAAALNTTTEFAAEALDIRELIPFNNRLADIQENYMPSYPPMSPVTSAFFAAWMVLDVRDTATGATLGEILLHYLQRTGQFSCLQRAIAALHESYCSCYEVTAVGAAGVSLRDIVEQQEFPCWNSSGYPGRKGEIWYVRLLPPFAEGARRWVTLGTPYVFRPGSRAPWEEYFQRQRATATTGAEQSLREHLKYGKFPGYWMEFVFQAYSGYDGSMVLVTGVPDDPSSLPHADPKHKL